MKYLDFAELNLQGKLFVAGNVAAKNFIAVATTQTGLVLYNPTNSRKKLVLLDAGFSWTTVPGAVHNLGIGLVQASGIPPNTGTVAGAPARRADGSGETGWGIAYDTVVLPTAPVVARWFGGASWGSSVAVSPYTLIDKINGKLVVVPGAAAAIVGLTTTAVGVGSFTWAEIDI